MLLIHKITGESVLQKKTSSNSFLYGWKHIIILFIVVGILRLLFVLVGGIDLDPEEAQYWLWSKYPDWSYYSKPPLIAYINGISSSLFGNHTWAVRLNAIITGSLIGLTTYYIANKLYKSKKMAFFIATALLLLPAYHYISMFFTTDVLVSLFWLLTCYFFWKAIKSNTLKYWILTGITIGLGSMAKYVLLFFIPFSFLYLLFKKKYLLKQKGFYISLLIATIIFSPVLIWNINNNMVGLFHISNLAGYGKKFVSLHKTMNYELEFFGGQLLLNLPLLFLLFFWKKYKIGSYLKGDFEQFIIYKMIFIYVIFTVIALIKRVQINWLIFSYIPLYIILFKAIWESEIVKNTLSKNYIAFTSLLLVLLLLQPIFETHTPKFSKIIPAKIDPYGKLVDWKSLTDFVNYEMKTKTNGNGYIILSDKYQIASQFSFYSPGNPKTYCLPYSGRRMNQFDVWGIPAADINGKQIVLIKDTPLSSNEEINSLIDKSSIIYATNYTIHYKDKLINTYYIYLLNKIPHLKNTKEVITKY